MPTIAEQRAAAVAETIAAIRGIEARKGVTREALEDIKTAMIGLARRTELFPRAVFSPPGGEPRGRLYRISEDPDHRFALYLNAAKPGTRTPPHDHTTWAVIAGVEGEEHQKIYQRTDDGAEPGKGSVEVAREFTITPGAGIAFLPDDIHSIHVLGERPILHLHMYGKALEEMTGRVAYDREAGTYATFPAHPDIMDDPGEG
ncbi:MAG: hypothetical protein ACTSUD_03550 [Alphaproteobacteria bacterium]